MYITSLDKIHILFFFFPDKHFKANNSVLIRVIPHVA